ncbi:hypothetical protein EI94DRAFT_760210 [Lactarius quietus]|nr:hypothetical protein EI94DRAFT_760210 [Lactarius quietus]
MHDLTHTRTISVTLLFPDSWTTSGFPLPVFRLPPLILCAPLGIALCSTFACPTLPVSGYESSVGKENMEGCSTDRLVNRRSDHRSYPVEM